MSDTPSKLARSVTDGTTCFRGPESPPTFTSLQTPASVSLGRALSVLGWAPGDDGSLENNQGTAGVLREECWGEAHTDHGQAQSRLATSAPRRGGVVKVAGERALSMRRGVPGRAQAPRPREQAQRCCGHPRDPSFAIRHAPRLPGLPTGLVCQAGSQWPSSGHMTTGKVTHAPSRCGQRRPGRRQDNLAAAVKMPDVEEIRVPGRLHGAGSLAGAPERGHSEK